jgi:hypothetical protein
MSSTPRSGGAPGGGATQDGEPAGCGPGSYRVSLPQGVSREDRGGGGGGPEPHGGTLPAPCCEVMPPTSRLRLRQLFSATATATTARTDAASARTTADAAADREPPARFKVTCCSTIARMDSEHD